MNDFFGASVWREHINQLDAENEHLNSPRDEDKCKECAHCQGEGYIYYNVDSDIIPRGVYDLLPESARDSEKCTKCDGVGEVIVEYAHPDEWEW